MRAPAVVDSTELCYRCGQAPLFPGHAGPGLVYCAACKGELRRQAIARQKRVEAARKRRSMGLGGAL